MKIFNLKNYEHKLQAKALFNNYIETESIIELGKKTFKRTNPQSKSRWLYLTMVSNCLNERGEMFYFKPMDAEVPFTKDLLYEVYWKSAQGVMFPGFSKLDTKQFGQVAEVIMDIFAKRYNINIEWPDATRRTE